MQSGTAIELKYSCALLRTTTACRHAVTFGFMPMFHSVHAALRHCCKSRMQPATACMGGQQSHEEQISVLHHVKYTANAHIICAFGNCYLHMV